MGLLHAPSVCSLISLSVSYSRFSSYTTGLHCTAIFYHHLPPFSCLLVHPAFVLHVTAEREGAHYHTAAAFFTMPFAVGSSRSSVHTDAFSTYLVGWFSSAPLKAVETAVLVPGSFVPPLSACYAVPGYAFFTVAGLCMRTAAVHWFAFTFCHTTCGSYHVHLYTTACTAYALRRYYHYRSYAGFIWLRSVYYYTFRSAWRSDSARCYLPVYRALRTPPHLHRYWFTFLVAGPAFTYLRLYCLCRVWFDRLPPAPPPVCVLPVTVRRPVGSVIFGSWTDAPSFLLALVPFRFFLPARSALPPRSPLRSYRSARSPPAGDFTGLLIHLPRPAVRAYTARRSGLLPYALHTTATAATPPPFVLRLIRSEFIVVGYLRWCVRCCCTFCFCWMRLVWLRLPHHCVPAATLPPARHFPFYRSFFFYRCTVYPHYRRRKYPSPAVACLRFVRRAFVRFRAHLSRVRSVSVAGSLLPALPTTTVLCVQFFGSFWFVWFFTCFRRITLLPAATCSYILSTVTTTGHRFVGSLRSAVIRMHFERCCARAFTFLRCSFASITGSCRTLRCVRFKPPPRHYHSQFLFFLFAAFLFTLKRRKHLPTTTS